MSKTPFPRPQLLDFHKAATDAAATGFTATDNDTARRTFMGWSGAAVTAREVVMTQSVTNYNALTTEKYGLGNHYVQSGAVANALGVGVALNAASAASEQVEIQTNGVVLVACVAGVVEGDALQVGATAGKVDAAAGGNDRIIGEALEAVGATLAGHVTARVWFE